MKRLCFIVKNLKIMHLNETQYLIITHKQCPDELWKHNNIIQLLTNEALDMM